MAELNNSRPVIEIELIRLGAGQTNKGVSSKNSQTEPTSMGDTIWHFELHWDFNLIIRNNSSFPVYDIELFFKEGKFDYIDKINPNIPILPHTEKILSVKYNRNFEGKGSESNKLIANTLPNDINQIKILSNYKSEDRKIIFRSAFTYSKSETPHQKNEIIHPLLYKRYIRQITIGSVAILLVTIATIVSGITDGLSLFDREMDNIDVTVLKQDLKVKKIYVDSIYYYLIEQRITITNNEKRDIFLKDEAFNIIEALAVGRNGELGTSLYAYLIDDSLFGPINEDVIYCNSLRELRRSYKIQMEDSIKCELNKFHFGGGGAFAGANIIRPAESKEVYLYILINPWINETGNRARYIHIKAKIFTNRSELVFEHTYFIEGGADARMY